MTGIRELTPRQLVFRMFQSLNRRGNTGLQFLSAEEFVQKRQSGERQAAAVPIRQEQR